MLDKISYPLTIAKARTELTHWNGRCDGSPLETHASGNQWFTIVDGNEKDVQLYYRLSDLFIIGFRVGSVGYHFRGEEGFMIASGTVGQLSYNASYLQMGWNRQAPVVVTLDSLNSELFNLRKVTANKQPSGETMMRIVISFAEAIRFDDVILNILQGKPIAPESLDWNQRGTGERVRVVKGKT